MLTSVNLAISSVCGANCIYCPIDKGERIEQKFMPFELVKKIIDEISSKEFQEKNRLTDISVSQNGNAFLHKDIIEILRLNTNI